MFLFVLICHIRQTKNFNTFSVKRVQNFEGYTTIYVYCTAQYLLQLEFISIKMTASLFLSLLLLKKISVTTVPLDFQLLIQSY